MQYLFGIFALGLTASVAALPTATYNNYVVHEKRTNIKRARAYSEIDRRSIVPMSIGLTQTNLENGHDYLMDVSSPDSPNYGKHWTAQEITETFSAQPDSIDAVLSWLGTSGISSDRVSIGKGQNWVHFEATIIEAESLLQTQYKVYDHPQSGKPVLGCNEYSIPYSLQGHVDFITPTVHNGPSSIGLKKRHVDKAKRIVGPTETTDRVFSFLNSTNTSGTGLASCTDSTTIECIQFLYNMPAGSTSVSSFGILELLSTFNQSDLDGFYAQESGLPAQGTGPDIVSIDGGEVGTLDAENGEATLDLEIAIPLVFPQPVTIYELGTAEAEGTFGNFIDAVDSSLCQIDQDPSSTDCGDITSADVVSISWGGSEAGSDAAYNTRQCNEFLKLGLQGITVIFSSGDDGVVSQGDTDCTQFDPQFGASCPYVTSVGATTLTNASPATLPEIAVNGFGSGGGFSNIFPMPSYQSDAVTSYLTNFPPPYTSSQFNNSGNARGYPDISANGQWLGWFFEGATGQQGGTSMSAPLVGSIITLINNARISAGKGRVGFINPTLYANPSAFNDIVTGFNNDDESGCGTKGFEAQTGWDPVTGLGTPDYEKLLAVFMALP